MIRTMDIADILKLPSVDSEGACNDLDGRNYGVWSVTNALECKDVSDAAGYGLIRKEMEADGYNRVPIHIDYGYNMESYTPIPDDFSDDLIMGNGHHRLKIAMELGHTSMLVTDDPSESDGGGEEQYHSNDFKDCGCDTYCDCDDY